MKKKNITIDELVVMVQNEFRNQRKYMDGRFDRLEKELDGIKADLEDLKSKISNVAYRFELNELSKRVAILERKIKSA